MAQQHVDVYVEHPKGTRFAYPQCGAECPVYDHLTNRKRRHLDRCQFVLTCGFGKLGQDPLFIDKVRDIVGLYLPPPPQAVFLCVEEKSQIQVLDRRRTPSPLMFGVAERRSQDHVRHGTTTLFAALDLATGHAIGELHRRHRATEFLKFFSTIEDTVLTELNIHLVIENYRSHIYFCYRGLNLFSALATRNKLG